MNAFLGLAIVESVMALQTTDVPLRIHRLRRRMKPSYHARVQKKWVKRFGFRKEPCMYKVSPRAVGMFGQDYIVAHPSGESDGKTEIYCAIRSMVHGLLLVTLPSVQGTVCRI